ncbi:MAG TPA: glycerate kinase [Gaiellaceae bacterium]|nr:glycerate kinase [Gaiellaceae bacterium]
MRALASPASLKGVLSAVEAAALLARGLERGGADAEALPVADGGEGTAEVIGGETRQAVVSDPLGRPVTASWVVRRDGTAVVDSAAALGLPLLSPAERDPLRASSSGLGELLLAVLAERPAAVVVGVGGTATVDGGAGLRAVLPRWPGGVPLRVACDVRSPLLDAARVFAPQKGAGPAEVAELERRLAADRVLAPYAELPGAGAGGGLGAALASLGGELVEGAQLVLDLVGFDEHARGADLVVTGEGTVDATTFAGKAPGAVAARCERLGVRCVLFGGRVSEQVAGAHAQLRPLSGDPGRARADLLALGEELARSSS